MYRIVPDDAVFVQVAALPAEALFAYADVHEVFALTPWNGEPQHEDNPNVVGRVAPAGTMSITSGRIREASMTSSARSSRSVG